MADPLKQAWVELKEVLEMVPIKQKDSFKIEALNNGNIVCYGMLKNSEIHMDYITIGDNVETRWKFQNVDLHFVVFRGSVDMHFRLNDNIHIKHLSYRQSIRIPFGIPFMLKTYENSCKILLISILEDC